MPSLALIFHLCEVASGGDPGPVSATAAMLAVRWCGYLEAHTLRIYQLAFESDPEPGRRLLERIKKAEVPDGFTVHWLYKRDWSGLSSKELAEKAVACLERHHILQSVDRPTRPGVGGAPTTDYFIHPTLHRKASVEVSG